MRTPGRLPTPGHPVDRPEDVPGVVCLANAVEPAISAYRERTKRNREPDRVSGSDYVRRDCYPLLSPPLVQGAAAPRAVILEADARGPQRTVAKAPPRKSFSTARRDPEVREATWG